MWLWMESMESFNVDVVQIDGNVGVGSRINVVVDGTDGNPTVRAGQLQRLAEISHLEALAEAGSLRP